MENSILSFTKPYLDYIDEGHLFRKPLSWLYYVIAIINLIIPLVILYQTYKSGIFSHSTDKFTFAFFIVWLIIALTGFVSFQLWVFRATSLELSSSGKDDFVATSVFSHFIQTVGEWLGTYIGLAGAGFALIATLVLGDEAKSLTNYINLPFLNVGWLSVITMPIMGFFVIVISRFISEQIKALTSIANNTKNQIIDNQT